jgi:hypothetical protein
MKIRLKKSIKILRRIFGKIIDPSIDHPTKKYFVDISKPPLAPPSRTFVELCLFGLTFEFETDESLRADAAWHAYMDTYNKLYTNEHPSSR